MSIYNNNGRWGRKSQQFHKAHSTDQRMGTTHFEYDKLGRITQSGNEVFAFDPAHNILSDGLEEETNISRTAHQPFRLQNTLVHTGM